MLRTITLKVFDNLSPMRESQPFQLLQSLFIFQRRKGKIVDIVTQPIPVFMVIGVEESEEFIKCVSAHPNFSVK